MVTMSPPLRVSSMRAGVVVTSASDADSAGEGHAHAMARVSSRLAAMDQAKTGRVGRS